MAALFIVLFSSGWIVGKVGLHSTGPLTLLLTRFGAAALVLLVVALLTRAPWPRSWIAYGHLAVVGLLMHGVAMAGVYLGLSLGVSAGASALIGGMAPLFTALAAGPMLDERVGPAQWSGLAIGLAGVALVLVPALRFEGLHAEWDQALILVSLWLTFVNSIGAISLFYILLRRGAASQVAALFFLMPPVTAVMGFAAFHETLSPIALVGFVLTAAGVYLGSRGLGSGAAGTNDQRRRGA